MCERELLHSLRDVAVLRRLDDRCCHGGFPSRQELPYPFKATAARSFHVSQDFFVREVRGDAVACFAMLGFGADLDLYCASIAGVHGRMDGLIAVGFWEGDVVLDLARHRPPMPMDDAERGVTVGDSRDNDAEGKDVIYLGDVPVFAFEFAEEAVNAFYARLGAENAHAGFSKLAFRILRQFLEAFLVLVLALLEEVERLFVFVRIGERERGVFELRLHDAHAEPVGDRRINFQRLHRDAFSLMFWHVFQGLRVMQTVHELDDEDADVFCGRGEEFAQGFRMPLHPAIAKRTEFGHSPYEGKHIGAEFLFDERSRCTGIFVGLGDEGGIFLVLTLHGVQYFLDRFDRGHGAYDTPEPG